MPAFVALHMVEHTLPLGAPRTIVKCGKTLIGIPFCVTAEILDGGMRTVMNKLKLPNTPLDMSGTIGVPSDIKLQDVFEDMNQWRKDNAEILDALADLYKRQHIK